MTERVNHFGRTRVLALDGGGLKGLFTAKFLADTEKLLGIRIRDYFDLIVGTSTGSIIALGIGLGKSCEEILEFYRSKGPAIFPERLLGGFHGWLRPKYSNEPLQESLTDVFGDALLGDSGNRLVIPAFNVQRREVKLFKTRHHSRLLNDWRMKAVEAAMASSAAPTYLPAVQTNDFIEFIDGGVWANNPALVGVVEALSLLQSRAEDIEILSIGTTRERLKMKNAPRFAGKAGWALQMADLFIGAQTAGYNGMVELLVPQGCHTRINPEVAKSEFKLDRLSNELIALGAREAEHASKSLGSQFFDVPVRPFTPLPTQSTQES